MPDWARDAVRNAAIAPGCLVVGDDHVLARYDLGPEGREAAVEHADRIAGDVDLRFDLTNLWLVESDEFDAVVYEYDGTRAAEIHRAAPLMQPSRRRVDDSRRLFIGRAVRPARRGRQVRPPFLPNALRCLGPAGL